MFSWASSQLESLAQTVAPPPTDPKGKFVIACQKGDEETSLQILNTEFMDPLREVVQSVKGQTALHMACLHGMQRVSEQILVRQPPQDQGSFMQMVDADGNSPLHSACMSKNPNALNLIKMLVELAGKPAVGVKNHAGQTPYDVASLNSVRQYLLPIQLQQETQTALDNGGVGLVPGMDLCGLKVTPKNVAPPPMMPQPSPSYSRSTSVPLTSPSVPPTQPPLTDATASSMFATPSPQPPLRSMSSPEEANRPPPTPPSSGSTAYALRGRSSAAMSTVKGIQPDGFHSSSSDKNLQAKYGHLSVNSGNAVPPPPSSGNSIGSYGAAPSSNGSNPYTGRLSAFGINGRPANRYVSYDPIQGVHAPPPKAAPSYSAPAGTFTSPTPSATASHVRPSFMMPPPPVGAGGQGTATSDPTTTATPHPSPSPPASANASNRFSRPAGTPPSSFPKPPGSTSSSFARPPTISASASAAVAPLPAGSSFPKPPTMTFTKPPSPTPTLASEAFTKPPGSMFAQPSSRSATTAVPSQSPIAQTVVESQPEADNRKAEPETAVNSDDIMDEVPLTPGETNSNGVSLPSSMPPPPLINK